MDKESCCFYERKHTPLGDYYVCNHSKTVLVPAEETKFEELCNVINKFLDDVQEKIDARLDWFEDLDGKDTLRKELTVEEQEDCDRLCEFQSVRPILKHETKELCGDNSGVPCRKKHALPCSRSDGSMETIKQALYRLLMISDWLKEKFGIEE